MLMEEKNSNGLDMCITKMHRSKEIIQINLKL